VLEFGPGIIDEGFEYAAGCAPHLPSGQVILTEGTAHFDTCPRSLLASDQKTFPLDDREPFEAIRLDANSTFIPGKEPEDGQVAVQTTHSVSRSQVNGFRH
jgi:hypothetical protein